MFVLYRDARWVSSFTRHVRGLKKSAGDATCIAGARQLVLTSLSRVGKHTSSATAVKGIAPERLHRERLAIGERDVGRSTLPR